MKKLTVSLALITLLYSCKKEKKITEKPAENSKITHTQSNYQQPPIYLDSLQSEDKIVSHLQQRKNEIISLLENSSSEKNNLIYENYKKENDSALALLSVKQANLLDSFYEFYDYIPETDKTTIKVPEKYKKTYDLFTKAEIEFWDVGEAYTELRMFPDFYLKIFNGKLTPDYQMYVETIAVEDKVLFQSDAAVAIPWRDVAKRVEVREKFLHDFPTSKLKPIVEKELQLYRYAYLLGLDNTSTQNDDGGFTPENLKEFHRFIKENPASETTKIIKQLLAMPKERQKVFDFVNNWLHYPYGEPLD